MKIIKQLFDDQGRLHSLTEPAELYEDGSYVYYKHGKVHRENDPALYFTDKACNSIDDPKYIQKAYMIDDMWHRENGPAIYYRNGNVSYYYQEQKCCIPNTANELEYFREFCRNIKLKLFK